MKTIFKSVILFPIVLLGCGKSIDSPSDKESVESITFTINRFKTETEDPFTKTSVGGDGGFFWAADDTVGIYPNTGSQVFFELTEGEGASSAKFDGGGWNFKASSVYYSYYPFIGNIYLDRTHIPVSYTGQKQTGIERTDHIGHYDFMYSPGSSAQSGNVSFTYNHLNCIIKFRLRLPAGTYSKLAITAPTDVFPVKGYYNLMSPSPEIIPTDYSKQLSIDLEGITVTDNQEFFVYLLSAPVNINGVEVIVSVLNGKKTELQCKKTPSREYFRENIYPLGCEIWTEVPQSMGLIVNDWEDGGHMGGDAD